jgi:hypothetical protein
LADFDVRFVRVFLSPTHFCILAYFTNAVKNFC